MEFIQQNIYLVAVAVLSGLMLLVSTLRSANRANTLSPTEATLMINRQHAQIIDVREESEYATGHLPEARNIPLAQVEIRVSELQKLKNRPLIFVCQSGVRSAAICAKIGKLEWANAHHLAGGINAWIRSGLPVHKPEPTPAKKVPKNEAQETEQ
ncbi:MAG: rhodanese-like domain-containing protein [Pseudomonadota bacterium]